MTINYFPLLVALTMSTALTPLFASDAEELERVLALSQVTAANEDLLSSAAASRTAYEAQQTMGLDATILRNREQNGQDDLALALALSQSDTMLPERKEREEDNRGQDNDLALALALSRSTERSTDMPSPVPSPMPTVVPSAPLVEPVMREERKESNAQIRAQQDEEYRVAEATDYLRALRGEREDIQRKIKERHDLVEIMQIETAPLKQRVVAAQAQAAQHPSNPNLKARVQKEEEVLLSHQKHYAALLSAINLVNLEKRLNEIARLQFIHQDVLDGHNTDTHNDARLARLLQEQEEVQAKEAASGQEDDEMVARLLQEQEEVQAKEAAFGQEDDAMIARILAEFLGEARSMVAMPQALRAMYESYDQDMRTKIAQGMDVHQFNNTMNLRGRLAVCIEHDTFSNPALPFAEILEELQKSYGYEDFAKKEVLQNNLDRLRAHIASSPVEGAETGTNVEELFSRVWLLARNNPELMHQLFNSLCENTETGGGCYQGYAGRLALLYLKFLRAQY